MDQCAWSKSSSGGEAAGVGLTRYGHGYRLTGGTSPTQLSSAKDRRTKRRFIFSRPKADQRWSSSAAASTNLRCGLLTATALSLAAIVPASSDCGPYRFRMVGARAHRL